MDATDRKILALLQQDGRLTVTELAERVGLSVSPCHRRVRALEESGAIAGYRAVIDGSVLGMGFEAIVLVSMHAADRASLDEFEAAVAAVPNVLSAERLFGEPDYLMRVVARDLADYQAMYDEQLATLPGVQRLHSTLVMKSIVEHRPLPV
jgi:DNA-binding Lrp family transcriptional regulator